MSHPWLHASARVRLFLVRHRSVYWLVVAAIAAAAAGVVQHQAAAAAEARSAWTETRPVLIAVRAIDAGEIVETAAVRSIELPRAAVAESAIATLTPGLTAKHPISAGEILLSAHLGAVGPGELQPGTLGVAVPLPVGASLPLTIGTGVKIIVGADPVGLGADSLGPELATGSGAQAIVDGVVVHIGEGTAVVAVDQRLAPDIATAAAAGRVVLLWSAGLLSPGS